LLRNDYLRGRTIPGDFSNLGIPALNALCGAINYFLADSEFRCFLLARAAEQKEGSQGNESSFHFECAIG
jgi:hypothetical protein